MDKPRSEAQQFLILTLILSEQKCQKFVRLAREKGIFGGMIVIGRGTVKSPTLNLLGIKSQKKEIVNVLMERETAKKALDYFTKELQLQEAGHGIAYTTPVIIAGQIGGKEQSAWSTAQGMEGMSMFQKLTVIVNRGMAEDVMDIARKSGVKGGTILHGRGTGSKCTEKCFGLEIEPEKELVMILLPGELVETVVKNLYEELKLDDPGNGILFVEPVLDVRGLVDSQQGNKDA